MDEVLRRTWKGYFKQIRFFGEPKFLVCDGECKKAWGINSRPCRLKDGVDLFLGDDELGFAPGDPGTFEGGDGKPLDPQHPEMNRWCARECERAIRCEPEGPLKFWSFPGGDQGVVEVEVDLAYLKDKRGSWR